MRHKARNKHPETSTGARKCTQHQWRAILNDCTRRLCTTAVCLMLCAPESEGPVDQNKGVLGLVPPLILGAFRGILLGERCSY